MIRRNFLFFSLFFTSIHASWAQSPKIIEVPAGSFYVVKGVNVRNGNFSITYKTSADNNDPSTIRFDRTYNSKSETLGSFGLGWGAAIDNTISFLRDGDLVIQENGTGAFTHYELKDDSPGQTYVSTEAANNRNLIEVENEARAAKEQLRQALVKKGTVPDQGPIEPLTLGPIPDRSVFIVKDTFEGDVCLESSEIRREGDRMIRVFGNECPTAREIYTLQGTLVSVESRQNHTGASLTVSRDPKTRLITAITDEKGKIARFRYDAKKRLVEQELFSGESQKFEYDDHNNMTTIVYLDDSKRINTYDGQDRVISTIPRTGSSARFEYLPDPYDPSISITRVTILNGDQKDVAVFKLHN